MSVLSKLLERHVHRHLVTHLETRELFHPLHSGFHRKHSCNTALARLTDSWLSDINRSDLSWDVCLDFKKAFELVDHRISLSKLSVYLNSSNYNMSLSVAPTCLKELLNIVYHKGQSWDLYSSASILMIYLSKYHYILQNAICSRMTPHFIKQEKSIMQIQENATALSWSYCSVVQH